MASAFQQRHSTRVVLRCQAVAACLRRLSVCVSDWHALHFGAGAKSDAATADLPAERLRIVVLEDTERQVAHAVLTVRLDGEVLVLDNLLAVPVPQERLTHYVPYYSVNELGQWQHARPTLALAAGTAVLGTIPPAPPASTR